MATIVGKNSTTETLTGGAGSDTLIGGAGTNNLTGGAGADIFKVSERLAASGASRDLIKDFQIGVDKIDVSAWGVSSFDQMKLLLKTYDGGSRFVSYYGDAEYEVQINMVTPGKLVATDFVFYSGGARTQTGTADSDLLFGGTKADTLKGSYGNDSLYGGEGNDILFGGEGADTLYGQGGSDTFKMVQKESARDIIMDFQVGIDRIDLSAFGVTGFDQLKYLLQTLDTGTTFRIYNKDYDQDVWILNVAPGKLTDGDFIFDTQDLKNQTAEDTGSTLFGGNGANTLLGGAGVDWLFGGAGNDILSGGLGSDTLYGQAGADTFKVATRVAGSTSLNFTTIADFQVGVDTLDVSGFGITSFEQLKLVMFNGGTYTSINADFGAGFGVTLTGVVMSKLTAGDFVFATQEARKLSGTTGDDDLFGGKASDRLSGGGGDDDLFGGEGNDILIGGDGTNDLYGQGGADIFKASKIVQDQNEDDTVHEFQVGLDKIDLSSIGMSSFDQLQAIMYQKDGGTFFYAFRDYGNFAMFLKGVLPTDLRASDFIFDKQAAKTETGTSAPDMLFGTTQGDTLSGGAGGDRLFGGGGNDKLRGGDGSYDELFGGAGADSLGGGKGMDRFYFLTLSDSGPSSTTRDTIVDFSIAEGDRMNLYRIDANTKKTGDQAFSFIGKSAFTEKAGELRYVKAASDTYIYGDVNGDGKADFSIRLDDAITLTKDQFIL
ncbi:M10 family metallopeptidase C-terminal domain-containing protein [Pararhizobium antarcticum]|uniref:Peptidase M10 serralysin C-terminal domain-containing protein n=1 Tax=Pararhizobium antarcticum TaxID=1798805 RepID=A0A657LM39_9HYPH|nr:M10 family metallopeptidase C-terminal domain-containing protein [Pararhizobium antarcticum]OJF91698.1 hypothetical protein AX760_23085 [Pararhizobium antarcticum]